MISSEPKQNAKCIFAPGHGTDENFSLSILEYEQYICVSFATCINFFLCQDVWLFSIKLILVKTSLWLLFVLYVSFAIKDNHQLSSLMSCQCYDCYLSVEKIRAWKISFNNRKLDGETSSLREELSLL